MRARRPHDVRGWAYASALIAGLAASTGALAGPPTNGGYWLSAQLSGPDAAVEASAVTLGLQVDDPRPPPEIPATVVGRVPSVEDALRWVAATVFDGAPLPDAPEPTMIREPAAPISGARLTRAHAVVLLGLVVTGANPDLSIRPIVWPRAADEVLPDDLPWRVAELLPARAPVFATPAPRLPPMRERVAIADRHGALYRLGTLDRCEGEGDARSCLRWAQVVMRDGDRFVGGYLPAFQVADPQAWVHGDTAFPAVQAVYSGVHDGLAQVLLLARAPDGILHHKLVEAPLVDGRLPAASVGLGGAFATLSVEGTPSQRFALDASLDRYPRD